MRPSTFSIVAFDPTNGDLGIAVESKFLGVVASAVAGGSAVVEIGGAVPLLHALTSRIKTLKLSRRMCVDIVPPLDFTASTREKRAGLAGRARVRDEPSHTAFKGEA